jgi:hypothetical protein
VRFTAISAWQAWAVLAAAIALAAWLFLLKLRPPRMFVPSLLLWQRVLDEMREQTLWERIRRAVSLIVTILLAALLALAATGPSRRRAGATGSTGRMLIVLDSSPSMLARTTTGETRWDRAVAEAHRLAASTAGDVAVATTGEGLIEGPTADRALIDAALERMVPTAPEAIFWPRVAGAQEVHFITDGAIGRPVASDITLHSVFEAASNVAITAFDVRRALKPDHAADAYLEIANYARSAQQVTLRLTRGSTPLLNRKVTMGAGETLRQVIPLAHGADAALRADVDAKGNALDIDDEAFGWIERPRPLSIAIVGENTTWLTKLFEGDPALRVSATSPAGYSPGAERSDVVIFDRWAPDSPPNRAALYFAPPSGRNPLAEDRPRWETEGTHPVVRGVDPFTLTIDKARAYRWPDLIAVVRSSRGTPLIYVTESTRRSILVTFGPHESNLTAAPAFPVLVGNALEWLTTGAGPKGSRRPGQVAFDSTVSTVTDPSDDRVALTRLNGTVTAILRTPGMYAAHDGTSRTMFAVNAGEPQLSNLMQTKLGALPDARTVASGAPARPWWLYCVLGALALSVLEWWTWNRRITV